VPLYLITYTHKPISKHPSYEFDALQATQTGQNQINMVMPRSATSLSLSVFMPAIRWNKVVLSWSTCPAVPGMICFTRVHPFLRRM